MGWFFGSGMFEVMFVLIFTIVIGMFVFAAVSSIRQWGKDNASPRLTVDAVVVSKRTDVARHSGLHDEHHMGHTSTSYYVTFQVDSGDRMELRVTGSDHGMLVEGDRGRLSFQGSRFLGFQRQI